MLPIIVLALLALLFFGIGFTIHFLWIVAVVLAVVWLVGFVLRPKGGRWYRW